jgi:dTDP-4-amino-4,6-dideoxygalactose transaminase
MSAYKIPFNRPSFEGNEQQYITQAIHQKHISGDGVFTRRCQELLESDLGVQKALLTTSCTDALELSALLLNLQPGDEVIIPSFTFVSTANAFALRGAKIRFADIRPDTLNMDENHVERLLSERTRAIVPVHYAGVACEMEALCDLADQAGAVIIEDNAHGLYGKHNGQWLGTFGAMATQSFHETKNFTCGEGGALLLNSAEWCSRAEIIREKGTNRSQFFRGEVNKYEWVDIGSSFLPSDMLAAFLYAQLELRESIQSRRKHLWHTYAEGLVDWASSTGVRLPCVPHSCEQAYHMFYLLLPSLEGRQALIAHLKAQGIQSVFHYLPLNSSPMGLAQGADPASCPITTDVSERLLRLPFFNTLSEEEIQTVIEGVKSFRRVAVPCA